MTANGQHRLVLVCDSDLHSVRGLRSVLRDAGLDVCVTQTADDALTRAALRIPDAAIIEMDVSDSSGSEVCRQLRQWSSMPIVMLSHTSDEDQVIEAFGAGANDYIGKPFRPRELVARLEAHMRRTSVEDNDRVLVLADGVRIDLAARRVHRDDDEIKLTPIEYRLLSALLRGRGRLLTHDDLLREVWGVAHAEDRQTLRAHVANLRRNSLHRKRAGSSEHTRASDTCSITAPASLRRSSLYT
jgi:two-component system, OmpR family, KDP operon response regulator KdpE